MKTKGLIFSIIGCLLCMVSAIVGVFALTDFNLVAEGNIEFVYSPLKADASGQYHYIEMGTYEQPVYDSMGYPTDETELVSLRWRLISTDGNTAHSFSDGKPTEVTGLYILEPPIEMSSTFGSSTNYATSTLRTYLNGTSMLETLNIPTDNELYQQITLQNFAGSATDKFFAPSYEELAMYGDEEWLWAWELPSSGNYLNFWARSPYDSDKNYSGFDSDVEYDYENSMDGVPIGVYYANSGDMYVGNPTSTKKVRPMFAIGLKVDSSTGEWEEAGKVVMYDSGSYYYVKMGTYEGSAIRWRYVSSDGTTPHEYGIKPTTLTGYYILETNTYDYQYFKSTSDSHAGGIYANDYGLSELRSYLTGSDFNEKYSISGPIYERISEKSLEELYVNIMWSGGEYWENVSDSQKPYYTTPTANPSDKFFAPSAKEVHIFDISDGQFWYRSAYSTGPYYVGINGRPDIDSEVYLGETMARPAFVIGLTMNTSTGDWVVDDDANDDTVEVVFDNGGIDIDDGTMKDSGSYYYVVMGTDNYTQLPMRWRYVSADGIHPYPYGTKPTSFNGYYILETETSDEQYFNSSTWMVDGKYATDYAASDLRAYFTGTENDNFVKKYQIAEDHSIYSQITAQSLYNMYSSIWHDGDYAGSIPSEYSSYFTDVSTNEYKIATDKFFAPSYQEVNGLSLDKNWGTLVTEDYTAGGYWLRSIYYGESDYSYYAREGSIKYYLVNESLVYARPAFTIGLTMNTETGEWIPSSNTGGGSEDPSENEPYDTTQAGSILTAIGDDANGATISSYSGSGGVLKIPSSVITSTGTYAVTTIGENAFKDCTNLTRIVIPASVTVIEENAFYGLKGENVEIIIEGSPIVRQGAFSYIGIKEYGEDIDSNISITFEANPVFESNVFTSSNFINFTINGTISSLDNLGNVERLYINGNVTNFTKFYNITNVWISSGEFLQAHNVTVDDYSFGDFTLYVKKDVSEYLTLVGGYEVPYNFVQTTSEDANYIKYYCEYNPE